MPYLFKIRVFSQMKDAGVAQMKLSNEPSTRNRIQSLYLFTKSGLFGAHFWISTFSLLLVHTKLCSSALYLPPVQTDRQEKIVLQFSENKLKHMSLRLMYTFTQNKKKTLMIMKNHFGRDFEAVKVGHLFVFLFIFVN